MLSLGARFCFDFIKFGVKIEVRHSETCRQIVHLDVSCFSTED